MVEMFKKHTNVLVEMILYGSRRLTPKSEKGVGPTERDTRKN